MTKRKTGRVWCPTVCLRGKSHATKLCKAGSWPRSNQIRFQALKVAPEPAVFSDSGSSESEMRLDYSAWMRRRSNDSNGVLQASLTQTSEIGQKHFRDTRDICLLFGLHKCANIIDDPGLKKEEVLRGKRRLFILSRRILEYRSIILSGTSCELPLMGALSNEWIKPDNKNWEW